MKPVPGICDRCGLRFPHNKLKKEYVLNRWNGLLVCYDCCDPSHPQLDTRGVRTDDKQSVKDDRSDSAEWAATRRLYAWDPVGQEATGVAYTKVGRVTVETS